MINRMAEKTIDQSTLNHHITFQKKEWDKRLEFCKTNFIKQLNAIDTLDSDAVKKMVDASVQEIRYNCTAFVAEQQLNCRAALDGNTPDTVLKTEPGTDITDYLVGGVMGTVAAILASIITTTTTSWIFFTATTAISTVVGSAIGVSAGVATLGIGAGVGLAAGVTCNHYMKQSRAQKAREAILKKFDTSVISELRNWGYDLIERANS